MSNQQPRANAQTMQFKNQPVEEKQRVRLLMGRFNPLSEYLKTNPDERENLAVMFADAATFKQSCAELYDTEEKKKTYFYNQWNRIVFTAIYLMDADFTNFDDFTIKFYTWLLEKNIRFPIKKEQLKSLLEQNNKRKTQATGEVKQEIKQESEKPKMESDGADESEKKRKELQQLEQQRKASERRAEQEQRLKALHQEQLQVEKQKRAIKQSYERNQLRDKMIDEREEKLNPARVSGEKSSNLPRPQQRSTSPVRENKYIAQPNSNNLNAANQNAHKNQTKSPMPANGQRYAQVDHNRRNEPIYIKNEPTKQELIKKVLTKICDCHECPEKRARILTEIRAELDNLRKVEEIERSDRFKMEKK